MHTNEQHFAAMPKERVTFLAVVKPNGVPHKEHMSHVSGEARNALEQAGITVDSIAGNDKTGFRGLYITCLVPPDPQTIDRVTEAIKAASKDITSAVHLYL